MAEKVDIWMPVYIAEYLASTMHLTCEESGAYLHLMFHSWKNGCPLPQDSEQIRRIARVEKKSWPRVWSAVKPFWTETEVGLVQKRVEKERVKWVANKETNVARATAAAAAREAKRAAQFVSATSPRSSPRSLQDDLEIIPSSSSSPDSSDEESSRAREANAKTPVVVELNPAALEIACAHPWATARQMRPTEIDTGDVVAIVQAIRAEARESGVSHEVAAHALLQFTRSYAQAVAVWPPGDLRFVASIGKFFNTFEYRKNPESWSRNGQDRKQPGRDGNGTRTPSQQRHVDGLGQILDAFPELGGCAGDGAAHGTREGELRDSDPADGMGRGNTRPLDGHTSPVWH